MTLDVVVGLYWWWQGICCGVGLMVVAVVVTAYVQVAVELVLGMIQSMLCGEDGGGGGDGGGGDGGVSGGGDSGCGGQEKSHHNHYYYHHHY